MSKIFRCAIYTRKSSEEGLEQDFNSLHAQREASEAYILSQKHEGWQVVRGEYDDGGYSGGNMNRPGLVRLMADIEAGKIDVVVVYKVDRLSRSLHDFAKMVEVFDRHGVSFVSVTQQFNTTTSMGRLTLNVLLSFAQFEREVTGERIRDKIAASKKKGMWMGGAVPLGYRVEERMLLPAPDEVPLVEKIFARYLVLGSVRALHEELKQQNIKTRSGNILSRGALYGMLSNPVYLGKIRHKENIYDGEHTAIIEQELWDAVQQQLLVNGPQLRKRNRITDRSILTGKIFDEAGEPLVPSHSEKRGRRYRYYISKSIRNNLVADSSNSWRVPAFEIEQQVFQALRSVLQNKAKLATLLEEAEVEPQYIMNHLAAAELAFKRLDLDQTHHLLQQLIERIDLKSNHLRLHIKLIADGAPAKIITTDLPMTIKRRGIEMRMVVGESKGKPDPTLLKAVARAHLWFDELATGKVVSIAQIERRENIDKGYVSRLLKLAFLPPKAIESIVAGTQPADWTVNTLVMKIPV